MSPIEKAAPGCVITPADAPIITPPASVAFTISSIQNLPRTAEETQIAERQLAASEIIVLPITNDFYTGVDAKYPALNDGQNIHKNRAPIIAKLLFIWDVLGILICLPYLVLPIKKLTTRPKYAPNV